MRFGLESTATDAPWLVEWKLNRNCSMAPGQMLGIYGLLCVVSLSIATAFWVQGAHLVMPFAWLELLAVGAAMLVYARHAGDRELISLSHEKLTVENLSASKIERVEFQPAWVRVEPVAGDGSLVELSGQGRRIHVGRFVRPELRRHLAEELRVALRRSHGRAAAAEAL